MTGRQHLLPDRESAQMRLFSLGVAFFVCVKDGEVIKNRRDISVLWTKLLFVNLERVQVVRLGRLLPARFSEDKRDVVEHRPQIGVREIFQMRPSRDRFLIVTDRFFLLTEVIAEKSK